jgi:hypothetical protein
MKLMKYVIALAITFCVTASVSQAAPTGTIQFLGSGSSALFIELGQGAATLADTIDNTTAGHPHCYWSLNDATGNVAARDDRPFIPGGVAHTDEIGKIWIAWGGGPLGSGGTCAQPVAPYNVYSLMSLDSVIGDRCFFMVNAGGLPGCLQVLTVAGSVGGVGGTAGGNLLGLGGETIIPQDVVDTLHLQRMREATTDIRPEDAKFASARMFAPCGSPFVRNPYIQTSYQTYGLGYQAGGGAHAGIGVDILSFTNPPSSFHVYDFSIGTGGAADPLSGVALPGPRASYAVSVVGAQPIIVVVSPNDGVAGRLATANDIMFSTLSEYMIGNYGRTSDLTGDTVNEHPVTTLIREPLSGTYNVFEYSVPNSNEFKTSQDINNCTAVGGTVNQNPLHANSANGFVAGAFRERALGTGQVVGALKAATTDTIGYFFWSAGNGKGFTQLGNPGSGKYLTVNGVDPLLDSYGMSLGVVYNPGEIPQAGNVAPHPPLTAITFKNVNLGDYAAWSALRIVSEGPGAPAGVAALITAAQGVSATAPDFIPLATLKVWKSHYNMFGIGVTNNNNGQTVSVANDLCPGSAGEGGGDAGAMTISIHGNSDFCTDFATPIGINDKNQ